MLTLLWVLSGMRGHDRAHRGTRGGGASVVCRAERPLEALGSAWLGQAREVVGEGTDPLGLEPTGAS